jgi:hypothetical protein
MWRRCTLTFWQQLTAQYLGVQLTIPMIAASPSVQETRVLDVRYIGATKERGDGGERTAFGWVNGEWSAIFPENVLLSWFGDSPEAADVPTAASPFATMTLYAVLALKRNASGAEVRSAYRRMARQWHPDVCHEPDAQERFIRIQRAYDVLKDPRLRARYDAGMALEASQSTRRDRERQWAQPAIGAATIGYRPPLRCGLVLAEGHEQLGRFIVQKVLAWEDIVDTQGRTLVPSWAVGADTFTEEWV